MLTRDVALTLAYRQELYHRTLRNSDGSPLRCRVNGVCKVWKTRPADFRLPVKHGLKECFYIEAHNAEDWFLTEDAARANGPEGRKAGAFPIPAPAVQS